MIKEVIKKGEHICSVCGRISAAASVLKETKDEKTGVITYRCSNQKKCTENKKKGLPKNYLLNLKSRRKEKKKTIVEKKAAETKTTEKVEAPATA
jgi:hypothetical protein